MRIKLDGEMLSTAATEQNLLHDIAHVVERLEAEYVLAVLEDELAAHATAAEATQISGASNPRELIH